MIIFYILGAILILWLIIAFPLLRCFIFNVIKVIFNSVKDLFYYFYDFKYNDAEPTVGKMICFCGLFGKGKTLSEVYYICSLYRKYNNKKVRKNGKLVKQRVAVLSNVTLNDIPYIEFTNLQQLVNITNEIAENDLKNGTYTVVYVLLDEAQNVLFCRNFKTNLSTDVLHVLTQIRKLKCSIVLSSTRWSQTDCTIRQDCTYTVDCNKFWRFVFNTYYDSWDYENAIDIRDIKSVKRVCWFATNKNFGAYDTHKLTEIISKDVESGNIIPLVERNVDVETKRTPLRLTRKGKKKSS